MSNTAVFPNFHNRTETYLLFIYFLSLRPETKNDKFACSERLLIGCDRFLTLDIVILCLNHMVWPCVELFIKQDPKQNPADPNYWQISPRVTCLTSFRDFRQNSIVTLLNFKMYQ